MLFGGNTILSAQQDPKISKLVIFRNIIKKLSRRYMPVENTTIVRKMVCLRLIAVAGELQNKHIKNKR
jgi:hypothetical protein